MRTKRGIAVPEMPFLATFILKNVDYKVISNHYKSIKEMLRA